ncbi:hypothetical protein GF380_05585 [Candidatus Uhrbacteria bacterium]|nr:hypothetical protein [Candidatus Uhrbacteria bacterium]
MASYILWIQNRKTIMLADYRVNIYNPENGELVDVLEAWRRLEFRHIVNAPGWCRFTTNAFSNTDAYINTAPIEVWRRLSDYKPIAVSSDYRRTGNWYVEWSGLIGDTVESVYENGDRDLTVYCDGGLDLINRRNVLWYASTSSSESKKVAIPAQTAIYQFVEENCGASATEGAGRITTGTIASLDIPVLIGAGDNWSGIRAWRNVLDVIQEIGNARDIDFDVVSLGDGRWQFLTHTEQIGENRTTNGLDSATGLNSYGNAPVIFSLEQHNVARVTYKTANRGSATFVAALGKGQYGARTVGTYTNSDKFNVDRRVNQREITRNATTQDSVTELETVAEEWGARMSPSDDFKFVPLLGSKNTVYGHTYWWGDTITARYNPRSIELDKRLVGVTIVVDKNGEQFRSWDFLTIPRT